MAVAHSMIVVGFYLIKHDLQFNDLGADFFDRRNREQATRRAIKRLNALGYNVHLEQFANGTARSVFSGEPLEGSRSRFAADSGLLWELNRIGRVASGRD